MNELTQQEFYAKVGAIGHREVSELADWLLREDDGGSRELDLRCRYAPSIVTRSEVEVFGMSEPRFAIRLYLEDSIVNLRQLEVMRTANPLWGRRMHWLNASGSESLKPILKPKILPAAFLRQASRIADCLLQPPRRLNGDWKVLRADLGREYGEASNAGELLGTPYVKHIPLVGGGLCAQAVCFMATALLHEHAKGIYGLLEVTALAQRDEIAASELGGFDVYEMQISGLNYSGIARYFSEVGLRVIKQIPKTVGYSDPSAAWTNRNDCFTAAARAYARSGMPMVLTVDIGRMAAPTDKMSQVSGGLTRGVESPIYERNGYLHPGFEKIETGHFRRRRDHVVLLVGCQERQGSEAFLINDPSTLPFLQASTAQLADAGYYGTSWSADGRHAEVDFENLRSLISLPVTPAEVKLPLLWWQPEDEVDDEDTIKILEERWRDGLFAIVPILLSGAVSIGRKRLPFVSPPERFRNFRLTQLKDLVPLCAEFLQGVDELPDIAKIRQQLLERFGWRAEHWAWVQFVREPLSIWIYDAERSLPANDADRDLDARQGFLRIGVWQESGDWETVLAPKRVARAEHSHVPAPPPAVNRTEPSSCQPAAMTSVSATGLEEALPAIQGRAKHIELYAFADADLDKLGRDPGQTALEFMSEHASNYKMVDSLAKRLREVADEAEVSIDAIATYLPELAKPQREDAKPAIDALDFLARLGDAVGARIVEIVVGSRIQGIWPGTQAGESRASGSVYVANVMSRAHLGQTYLENLKAVVEEMDVASPIRFALELEPGPFHLLNDWDALVWFALQLESEEFRDTLGPRVGFNLDIGHWAFLTGIRLDDLAPTSELGSLVRRRILHAHVSDHRLGHFGDLAIGTVHTERDFAQWLELLDTMAAEERPTGLEFSRRVSAELEASRSPEELEQSMKRLRSWLGQ
ncbi:MAG: TIM barrel protein [Verrucomicrobiota bacterium]